MAQTLSNWQWAREAIVRGWRRELRRWDNPSGRGGKPHIRLKVRL